MAPPDTPSSSNQDRRQRILNHMNKDHGPELSRFLRHFCDLAPEAAASAVLREVTMSSMLIHAPQNGRDYSVPFSPPLASLDEMRPRLIAMDEQARQELGLSEIVVTEYHACRGLDLLVFGSVLFYFCCAASLPWLHSGTAPWRIAQAVFPGGAPRFRWIVRAILLPVLGIHFTEMVLLDRWKLRRHGVQRWSKLWWQWEMTCFMDGYRSFGRFDALVQEKRRQKDAKRH